MIAGVRVQIPLDRNYLRTNIGGGICPLCKWAADNGQPHNCITHPDTSAHLEFAPPPTEITIQLAAHPADPFGHSNGRNLFRAADRTWCTCQCSPANTRPQDGGARS